MISTPTQPCHNGWWAWVNTWNHWEESGLHKRLCYSVLHWADKSVVHWWRGVSVSLCPVCMDTHHKGLTKPPWSHALGLSTWLWWPSLCHPKVIHHPKQWFSLPSGSVIQYFLKSHSSIEKGQLTSGPKRRCYGMVIHSFWKVISESPLFKIAVQNFRNKTLTTRDLVFHLLWAFSLYEKKSLSREKPCIENNPFSHSHKVFV